MLGRKRRPGSREPPLSCTCCTAWCFTTAWVVNRLWWAAQAPVCPAQVVVRERGTQALDRPPQTVDHPGLVVVEDQAVQRVHDNGGSREPGRHSPQHSRLGGVCVNDVIAASPNQTVQLPEGDQIGQGADRPAELGEDNETCRATGSRLEAAFRAPVDAGDQSDFGFQDVRSRPSTVRRVFSCAPPTMRRVMTWRTRMGSDGGDDDVVTVENDPVVALHARSPQDLAASALGVEM